MASSTEAEMRETTMTSSTQIRREERWEGRYGVQEQVTISGAAGAAASVSARSSFTAEAVTTGAKEVQSEPFPFFISSLVPLSQFQAWGSLHRLERRYMGGDNLNLRFPRRVTPAKTPSSGDLEPEVVNSSSQAGLQRRMETAI